VDVRLSTRFHPQTDGASERVNQSLEQYLRCFIDYAQDDWADLLPTAEFAFNNSIHTALGCSPFFALYGYNPVADFHSVVPSTVPAAEHSITKLQDLHNFLYDNLSHASALSKKYADKKRLTPPDLPIGSFVFLNARTYKSIRPSPKLDFKHLGPFEVLKKINDVLYKIKLPPSMSRIHSTMNIDQLEPAPISTIPNRSIPPPAPIILDTSNGEPEYEVESLLDIRRSRRTTQYLVKWLGYEQAENTWEKESELTHCDELISAFHKQYPTARATLSTKGMFARSGIRR
jgi:hypothetical protein